MKKFITQLTRRILRTISNEKPVKLVVLFDLGEGKGPHLFSFFGKASRLKRKLVLRVLGEAFGQRFRISGGPFYNKEYGYWLYVGGPRKKRL